MHEEKIRVKSEKVQEMLTELFALAFSMTAVEIYENTAELAVQVANACNPIKGLSEGGQIILDIKEAAKKLLKSTVVLAKLGRALAVQMPKAETMRVKIAEKKKTMENVTGTMERILKGDGPLTEEDANDILVGYGSFKESATAEDIAELGSILEVLATTACDAIDGADTLLGVGVALVAAGA